MKSELMSGQVVNLAGFRIEIRQNPSAQVSIRPVAGSSSSEQLIKLDGLSEFAVVCSPTELETITKIGSVVCMDVTGRVGHKMLSIRLGAGHLEAVSQDVCELE